MRFLSITIGLSLAVFAAPLLAQNAPPPPPPPPGGGGGVPAPPGGGEPVGGGGTGGGGTNGGYAPPINSQPVGGRSWGGSSTGGNQGNGATGNGDGQAPAGDGGGALNGNQSNNGQTDQQGQQNSDDESMPSNSTGGDSGSDSGSSGTAPPEPPRHMHVIQFQDGESTVYCRPGDMIKVTGHYDSTRPLDHSFLEIDRGHAPMEIGIQADEELDVPGGTYEVRPCADAHSDSYTFEWVATTPGSHPLHVGYILNNGHKDYTDRDTVVVLDAEPLLFQPEKLESAADLPVTVTGLDTSSFIPTRIEVFFDDKSIATVTTAPFQFTLPMGSAKPGKHSLRIEAYNAGNNRYEYISSTGAVVPLKMTLDVPPTATLDKTGIVTVTPKIADSYKPTKIDYYLRTDQDDKIVYTANQPPFVGTIDCSKLLSGSYVVHATATAPDGEFKTDEYTVKIKNAAADANAVAIAKQAAEQQADQQDQAAEAAAAAALKQHPKLTWFQLRAKVTNFVSAYLVDHPVAPGSVYGTVKAVEKIDQPDPTKNVYTATVIVQASSGGGPIVYTVDTDSGSVTPAK